MQTGITQTSPGGKARAFCDIVGSSIGNVESNSFTNLAQTLLPYATGSDLDFLGAIFLGPRLGAQDASSSLADDNFQFYVRNAPSAISTTDSLSRSPPAPGSRPSTVPMVRS